MGWVERNRVVVVEERIGPGEIDESARSFSPEERHTAELLACEGKKVTAVVGSDSGPRPDALVDGDETEFEILGLGATSALVAMALSRAARHAGHAVIDARASGLSQHGAHRGAALFLETPQAERLVSFRIAGRGFDLHWGC